jgi:hypothetical protein
MLRSATQCDRANQTLFQSETSRLPTTTGAYLMTILHRKIHALLLTMAILVAAVAFSTSGTIAQDKVVWSLGGSDNHTSEVISTTGPIEVR